MKNPSNRESPENRGIHNKEAPWQQGAEMVDKVQGRHIK